MGKAYVYVGTNSLRGSQGIYTLSLDTQSGIMEVIDTAAAQDSAYLCLSRDGRRLGYGGGYYDRYLIQTTSGKIALCQEKMLEEEIPAQEWDLGMDKVVTERCVYSE